MEGLVSVIIPTYNRSAFLREAIESVISQTYRPIECIIVDDGSNDNTKEVVAKIQNSNISSFTVKYIFQQNAGSQVARNTGTAASTGEFIQYLDSDDLLYPEKIEKQVLYLTVNKEVDGVFGDWEMGTPGKKDFVEAWDSDDMILQLLTERIIVNFSFLMKKGIIDKIGDWDVNIKRNQEIDFQVRGLLEGAKFKHQKLTSGLWRIHEGKRIANTTSSKEYLTFFQKWEKILKKKDAFTTKIKDNISNMYYWLCINNHYKSDAERIEILKEAIRLNPKIHFIDSYKMRLLSKIIGQNLSLKCWLYWSDRHRV
jgi:glycosyltransferase involved in cell wall biosynthesis